MLIELNLRCILKLAYNRTSSKLSILFVTTRRRPTVMKRHSLRVLCIQNSREILHSTMRSLLFWLIYFPSRDGVDCNLFLRIRLNWIFCAHLFRHVFKRWCLLLHRLLICWLKTLFSHSDCWTRFVCWLLNTCAIVLIPCLRTTFHSDCVKYYLVLRLVN